ncbi:hypothetical protein ACIBCM_03865 [Streptomyces sp. NPDC051018]
MTFTPPAEPSTERAGEPVLPAVTRFFGSAMKALGFSGRRIAV